VFRRHSASLCATVRMLLGKQAGCEDVVADVFVRFWMAPSNFDPERGSQLGYLRLQAKSRSVDLLRCEASRRRRETNDQRDKGRVDGDVDSALITLETGQTLRNAVDLLPPAERAAVQLAFYDGLTYQAVALYLNVPEGTAKSRIRTGLRRLRRGGDLCALAGGDGPAATEAPPISPECGAPFARQPPSGGRVPS
jgi:RNA polymerase sigma-70 factor (ECF subfamily)